MNPARADALARHLRALIDAEGPLPFSRFMAIALYHAEHGYYAQADFTTGREGDFATAPDAGPLFGATLARLVERFAEQPGRYVEVGPGSGRLVADVLAHLSDGARARLDVVAVEPFEARRVALEERLGGAGRVVGGLHEIDHGTGEGPVDHDLAGEPLDRSQRTLLVANEVLDAQPTDVVRRTPAGWQQQVVTLDEDRFVARWSDADPALAAFAEDHAADLPVGQRYEACPAIASLFDELARIPGRMAALLFDYGGRFQDIWPDRPDGTLRAFRAHQQVDPLSRPGETDLTFDVDFTATQQMATRAGLRPVAYGEQERLLLHLGLVRVAQEHDAMAAAKQLLVPGAFAGRFQALVVDRGGLAAELGLEVDLRDPSLWARAAGELA